MIGADEAEYDERVRELQAWTGSATRTRETMIAGHRRAGRGAAEDYEEAGVERIFLQHLAHRDIEMVELIGREIVPAVA